MKRVVLDTSVIVSALLKPDGKSRRVFKIVLENHKPLLSIDQLAELEIVLQKSKFEKFITLQDRFEILALLLDKGELVNVISNTSICRDESDNKFLNLAVDGKADIIITRDPDLLILADEFSIRIANPEQFLTDLQS
ncbi:MAG TPA: putative toxin-antitoxin system toxin component, PIN family [Cytophagales bacterium]|nr:putative toxin-antitoxin system toxin component, PIN family [Cytophagales bacterium]HRG10193.1 putative toxin-antitoxin system toxin component, PIN family [Cyclobacteriaceae bacterium]